jgi:hypothetical protein
LVIRRLIEFLELHEAGSDAQQVKFTIPEFRVKRNTLAANPGFNFAANLKLAVAKVCENKSSAGPG